MKLTRVTITGADDAVDPNDLLDLVERFPFVEFGFLLSSSRSGGARYPSAMWLAEFAKLSADPAPKTQLAAHFCGDQARRILDGASEQLRGEGFWGRIQLNGFSQRLVPSSAFTDWLGEQDIETILQVDSPFALGMASEIHALGRNVSALWDVSGGTGASPSDWPKPPGAMPLGYAGGFNPGNVVKRLKLLTGYSGKAEFSIDVESGIRTDDKFDPEKAREFLELAEPFVSEGV